MAEFTTRLEGLSLPMRIGIHPAERAAPQRVIVSVWLDCRYPTAPFPDEIDAVVDYDFLRREIMALADSRHFNLQETFCEAIAALALADDRVWRVRVSSLKPDIYPDAAVGCDIVRERAGG
ncbi:MAG: dihydroneopterin aldolase [Sphingomonas sp. 28-62-20]|uniref:dihydroneopterin aldolase n=1 Tax=Sphingomonas sp. 28-62-20 TaxID=1970433 RepID=UPI000BCAEA6F|nr:MAG: dihydroneopterin aldolase [Sphingomonas sp. 28-62-20]